MKRLTIPSGLIAALVSCAVQCGSRPPLAVADPPAAARVTPSIRLPAAVVGEPGDFLIVRAETQQAVVRWVMLDKGLTPLPPELVSVPKVFVAQAKRPGVYRVLAYTAAGDVPSEPAVCTVTVTGTPDPGPVPPVPPDPGPTPGPSPFPDGGLRVLVVYESADLPKMPAAQQAVLYSAAVRKYLEDKCAAGPEAQKEYRIWDKDVDAGREAKHWQAALAAKRDATPWVVIGNGKRGFSGPLPATADEFLKLVQQYEGK